MKKLKQKLVFKGRIFAYEERVYETSDGAQQGSFDILHFSNWVNVMAFDGDKIVLVEQFRAGIEEKTLEIPGGAIDPGEDPIDAAKRELREESGYTSSQWIKLGRVHPNPAFQSNQCWTFLALKCQKTHNLDLDPMEEIEVKTLKFDRFSQLIEQGEITHSLVIAAHGLFSLWKEKQGESFSFVHK